MKSLLLSKNSALTWGTSRSPYFYLSFLSFWPFIISFLFIFNLQAQGADWVCFQVLSYVLILAVIVAWWIWTWVESLQQQAISILNHRIKRIRIWMLYLNIFLWRFLFKAGIKHISSVRIVIKNIAFWKFSCVQAWTNCAPDADRARSGPRNLWDVPDFPGTHILPCKKQKTVKSTNFPTNK